jgi:hypothetical protein
MNDPLMPTYENEKDRYDLIHSRCIGPGIKKSRWPGYLRDLRRLLRRNGWVQLVEYHYIPQSNSGRLTDDHSLQKWGLAFRGVMDQLDRETRIGPNLANKLRDAGFRDVQSQIFNVPIGNWPTGELAVPGSVIVLHCRRGVRPTNDAILQSKAQYNDHSPKIRIQYSARV